MISATRGTITDFISDIINNGVDDSCHFMPVDERYSLVFAWNSDNELCGKIAYNCDELQCDYMWDWTMPITSDGDVIDTEILSCETIDPIVLCDEFEKIYSQIE